MRALQQKTIVNAACLFIHYTVGVATNVENLEYSGISLNMEYSGNSVQPQGKILITKVVLVCRSNICVKQLLTE